MDSKGITPKDALEGIIWRLTSYEDDLELRETDKKEIEIINQALDRLEQLEKENQDLKDNETIVSNYAFNLIQENEKLKKAINILKDKKVDLVILLSSNDFREYNANITIRINGVTYLKGNNYTLAQQEYDLLKELLENVQM